MKQFDKSDLRQWELDIISKYPLIFSENESLRESFQVDADKFVSLRYGFEHEEGWSGLVDEIGRVGTQLVTHLRANGYPDSYIHGYICKQKFGSLNWQGDSNLPDPFNRLWLTFTNYIEVQSCHICELSGKTGELYVSPNGYLRTLCKEEADKLGGFVRYGEKVKNL